MPDKLKGTLGARDAARAIAEGWRRVRPGDVLEELPMSDGGDGFGDVIGALLGAEKQTCATVDAAGRPRDAAWWFDAPSGVAVVETAESNGLALLPPGKHHPLALDTFGVGALLRAAESAGATRVYAGVGGSATNDGGFGLARALGFRFLDAHGGELCAWTELERLATVEHPTRRLELGELLVAVDVMNPLLGADGATRVFGPQKGLAPSELAKAEACLGRLAELLETDGSTRFAAERGAGAAGGLGFGLHAFCGGALTSGAGLFARLSELERRIERADLVVTAEGSFDAQSLLGKGVGMVCALSARAGKPCWCLAGSVSLTPQAVPWSDFRSFAIVPDVATRERSFTSALECLRELATRAALAFDAP